mgnify:CR=1 FL=1
MEGSTQAVPFEPHPTPIARRSSKARRVAGVTASSVVPDTNPEPPRKGKRGRGSKAASFAKTIATLLLGALLASTTFALMPHGQRSRDLSTEDARQVASDPRRPAAEIGSALLRLYYSMFISLDSFEDNVKADGELGANARALLMKLKTRIDRMVK